MALHIHTDVDIFMQSTIEKCFPLTVLLEWLMSIYLYIIMVPEGVGKHLRANISKETMGRGTFALYVITREISEIG